MNAAVALLANTNGIEAESAVLAVIIALVLAVVVAIGCQVAGIAQGPLLAALTFIVVLVFDAARVARENPGVAVTATA